MKPTKMLSFSDIHLGKNRLDQVLMTSNLRSLIFPLLEDVSFVNIGGDLFDEALGLGDVSTLELLAWVVEFLQICDRRGITVRILKGTHSHDRTQLQTIPVLHKTYGFTNDLRYFDKVSLEYIESHDMRVLYIPDNTPYKTSDDVMEVVRQMMETAGWDYVDYVFAHCYFEHVVPEGGHVKSKIFRKDQFDFVRRAVLIGHVHTPSMEDKFIYHGSTDRTGQGEEEPKGAILVFDDGHDRPVRFRFVENKNAFVFKTYRLSSLQDVTEMVRYTDQKIAQEDLNRPLYIRIVHPDSILRHACVKELKRKYPTVDFTHQAPKADNKTAVRDTKELIESISLIDAPTRETLPEAVISHLSSLGVQTSLGRERVAQMLREVA